MPESLHQLLFPRDDENTYAIIDGAACEELLDRLDEFDPRYYCLYAGELEPDVEEVAPYVVELLDDHPFTDWLLANGPGQHWGVFARSAIGLRALRKHCRTFLLVKDPAGKVLGFRYYDPRVLRLYLPTCETEELAAVFGPVSTWFCEAENPAEMISFRAREGDLEAMILPLEAA